VLVWWPPSGTAVAALHSHPLYVHPHSKHALMTAVNIDTHFLAELNVIDYSLLVGVDATTNELVVGLVGTTAQRDAARLAVRRRRCDLRTVPA